MTEFKGPFTLAHRGSRWFFQSPDGAISEIHISGEGPTLTENYHCSITTALGLSFGLSGETPQEAFEKTLNTLVFLLLAENDSLKKGGPGIIVTKPDQLEEGPIPTASETILECIIISMLGQKITADEIKETVNEMIEEHDD